MNYKQKALDHVRSVCPELMEFKRGCEVVADQNGIHYWYKGEDHQGNHWYQSSWAIHCNDLRNNPEENGLIKGKIIGHTPHLEHWLRGIELNGNSSYENIQSDGEVLLIEIPNGKKESFQEKLGDGQYDSGVNYLWSKMEYNLTKDEQSEDFYKAYCEIVGIT